MKRRVIDVENTFRTVSREGKQDKVDLLPFSGHNSLVSVGIRDVDTKEEWYFFFNHMELASNTQQNFADVQRLILETDQYIGHNFKHDIMWLRAAGFDVPKKPIWDTSIAEYVLAKGQVGRRFDLATIAEERKLTLKRSDLIQEYLDRGEGFEVIPRAIVEEYGRGDLLTTEELFFDQLTRLDDFKNKSLLPTIEMMGEFSYVLAKWQANGIKIDKVELERVREEYRQEQAKLIFELEDIARKAMGDTPFNLNSNEDKSVLLYSRRVKDKEQWKAMFNLGLDDRGKKLRRPRMKRTEFIDKIRQLTDVEYKTEANHCHECSGIGRVTPPKKDGSPGKAKRICKACNGVGVLYNKLRRVAGFKFLPANVNDIGVNGFNTDFDTLDRLLIQAKDEAAINFIKGLQRLNAVNTYINTFCDGILHNLQRDNFLYTNFNQIVTATGRLSSTDPNFQNQPRGKTFPVRGAVVSRFENGVITEADMAQLEFRSAGELSKDPQILKDILAKVDVHAFTRDRMNEAGANIDRQTAKSDTFKPLYGGMMGSPAQMAYYEAFRRKYARHTAWQNETAEFVLKYKYFKLPTGRQYTWPYVKRNVWSGRVEFFTQIVNYPVQGFATGDIVPVACILLDCAFTRNGLRSVPFLTVHDSIAVDTHPDEKEIVARLLAESMLEVRSEFLRRYNYSMTVPLAVEVKQGKTWLDGKIVLTKEHEVITMVPSQKKEEFYDDRLDDL